MNKNERLCKICYSQTINKYSLGFAKDNWNNQQQERHVSLPKFKRNVFVDNYLQNDDNFSKINPSNQNLINRTNSRALNIPIIQKK